MRSLTGLIVAMAIAALAGCGSQEQPPGKPAAPAVTAPAQPPTAPPPAAPPQPATPPAPAPVVEAPKTYELPPATAKPAKPDLKALKVADTLTLPASQGAVTLPHLAHAKRFPCATCHGDGTPGKLDLTKDTAHALCRDCHQAKGAGPTNCGGCHKK